MTDLTANFYQVNERIRTACQAIGRKDLPVLLAVSKRHTTEKIQVLAALGQTDFGENYAQEGVAKIQQLADLNLTWHFIGPIQSNKTKPIAEHFAWVQSVDRMKILERLNQHRPDHSEPLNVLLQIKIGDEESKSGAGFADIETMCVASQTMRNVKVRGLMCIPPPAEDPKTQLAYFAEALDAFEQLQQNHPDLDTLSMGMSNDMESAIQAGTTMVRVGTDLFGARPA